MKMIKSLALASFLVATTAFTFNDVAMIDTPFTVYVSPTGADSNDGLTPVTGVKTLNRVQQIVAQAAPTVDVEVRIRQGLYTAGQTTWNTFIPGHTISFMPIDYVYGMNSTQFAGRPIFRSSGGADWWFYAQPPAGYPSPLTSLRFYYLQVDMYNNGLMFRGGYTTDANGVRVPTQPADGNTVYGMNFLKLGNKYSALTPFGVAGVDLVNSSYNDIRANHFRQLENGPRADWSHLHAVYLAHGSRYNNVFNNELKTISGSGINIRNGSNFTEVAGNTFDHVGLHAALSDWFCSGTCVSDGNPQECASYGTEFHDNTLGLGYDGLARPSVELTPAGNTYWGPAPCPVPPAGVVRVNEYDNA